MIFESEYTVIAFNFAGTFHERCSPQPLEVGAIRHSKSGSVSGRYSSLIRPPNLGALPRSDFLDYGLEEVELGTAPELGVVFLELSNFCKQGGLISWQEHDIIHITQLMLEKTASAQNLWWLPRLDLRSYLSCIAKRVLSRDLAKELNKCSLSVEDCNKPLVRCQRMVQLLQYLEEESQEDALTVRGSSTYELFEF